MRKKLEDCVEGGEEGFLPKRHPRRVHIKSLPTIAANPPWFVLSPPPSPSIIDYITDMAQVDGLASGDSSGRGKKKGDRGRGKGSYVGKGAKAEGSRGLGLGGEKVGARLGRLVVRALENGRDRRINEFQEYCVKPGGG